MPTPAQTTRFLSVAYDLGLITRRQAMWIHTEHLRQHAAGVEQPCNLVASELGIIDRPTCEAVYELQAELRDAGKSVEDVVVGRNAREMPLFHLFRKQVGRTAAHILLAAATGLLWLGSVLLLDAPGVISGIVFFVLWNAAEAILTADEPIRVRRHRALQWPTIIRWSIALCWATAVAYALTFSVLLLGALESPAAIGADVHSLGLRAFGGWLLVAFYSLVLGATSTWRRWRLRCIERREVLLRQFASEIAELGIQLEQGHTIQRRDLDALCITLARAISCNHWNRIIARAIVILHISLGWLPILGRRLRETPSHVSMLEATTAAVMIPLREQDSTTRVQGRMKVLAIGARSTMVSEPDDVRRALDDIRDDHHPAVTDKNWFRSSLEKQEGGRRDASEFRRLKGRKHRVSLIGSAFAYSRTVVANDLTRCRTFDESYKESIRPQHATKLTNAWLDHQSAIACTIPPNARPEELLGGLIVLRNVPFTILPQEVAIVANAARALAPLVRGVPVDALA